MITRNKFSDMVTFHVGQAKTPFKLPEWKLIECAKHVAAHLEDSSTSRTIDLAHHTATAFKLFYHWFHDPNRPISVSETTTAANWSRNVVDALFLGCQLGCEGFVQRMLKFCVECSDHYGDLPKSSSIARAFESKCGNGICMLVVDLAVHEAHHTWLPNTQEQLKMRSGGEQFMRELNAKMWELRHKISNKANAPYNSDFATYHVDGFKHEDMFGVIEIEDDDLFVA